MEMTSEMSGSTVEPVDARLEGVLSEFGFEYVVIDPDAFDPIFDFACFKGSDQDDGDILVTGFTKLVYEFFARHVTEFQTGEDKVDISFGQNAVCVGTELAGICFIAALYDKGLDYAPEKSTVFEM